MTLFAVYAVFHWGQEYRAFFRGPSPRPADRWRDPARRSLHHGGERMAALPRVLPFVVLLSWRDDRAWYGGFATPSETAGLGAVLALVLIVVVYGAWRLEDLKPIFAGTVGEAGMLLMIIGMSLFIRLRDELPAHQPGRRGLDRGRCIFRNGCCWWRSC